MSRSLKQESGKARAQSLARRTATKVLQRGALQLLAAKLCVEESAVRQYVWNGTWLESRPLAKSRRLSERAARLEEELPEIFAHWGQRRLLRVGIALLACHPVVQILHLSFHTTSAKRAVIFTAFLSGSLAVSGLFMSASGAALDSTSDLECTIDENVMQFVVIGLVSMLLNALPRMCLDRMGRRSFAPETKASSQWRAWLRNDVLFWLLAAALLSFYLLFICSFLANIAKSEDWKCTVSFATILVGKLCTTPATRVCIQLSCAEATLFLFPDLTARELGLHAHGQAGQASDASQKVVELANRGIRVRHLLDFYEKVLQRDFFDPDRSTTHDVVRHAIIPWSLKVSTTWCDADEVQLELKAVDAQVPQEFGDVAKSLTSSSESESLGAAYATVVNGEPVAALKLVIHGWGNLFRTLLAAVFADALGHTDYDETLELLREQGLKTIRAQLSSLNKMDFPYWICAFSVNQHAGICGQPPETDSIGRSIAACGCETPKHRTGDECETNKFHELVEYMCKFNSEERKAGREMQRLGQVVAVDIGFNLFNRLWCVAELSHAEKLHLPQALKLHSSGSKERCFEKLHHLDVQAAEVTYEEDREVVLEKIGDSELFNEELKGLMFNQLDGFLFSERGKLNLEELVSRVVDSL